MRYHEVDASKLQVPTTPTSQKSRKSLTQMFSPKSGGKSALSVPPLHPGGSSSSRKGRPPMRPSPSTNTPRRISRRGSSCGPADRNNQEECLSPQKQSSLRRISLFHVKNEVDDLPPSPPKPSSLRRLSLFGKKEEEDDTEMDINLLKSPQLERNILRKDAKMFSPVKSIRRLSINLSKTLNSSFSSIHNDDDKDTGSSSSSDDDDSSQSSDDDSFDSDDCHDKKLSENDVALLLCREFSLMDDDDDE